MSVKYLVLMGVINMLLETLSTGLGIAVPVLIIWVLHMKKRAHLCCIHLVDYAPDLIMVGSASTIMKSSFLCLKGMCCHILPTEIGDALLPVLFYVCPFGLEYKLLSIIYSYKTMNNT